MIVDYPKTRQPRSQLVSQRFSFKITSQFYSCFLILLLWVSAVYFTHSSQSKARLHTLSRYIHSEEHRQTQRHHRLSECWTWPLLQELQEMLSVYRLWPSLTIQKQLCLHSWCFSIKDIEGIMAFSKSTWHFVFKLSWQQPESQAHTYSEWTQVIGCSLICQ